MGEYCREGEVGILVNLALVYAPVAQKLLILFVKGHIELGGVHGAKFFHLRRCELLLEHVGY